MAKINLDTLTLQGFKSINGKLTIHFNELKPENGLFFISGDNRVESDLGSNGAGKSTIFEGICWTLYGKTSLNLKAGNIKSWHSSEKCVGSVIFYREGIKHEVRRAWNPNSLMMAVEEANGESEYRITDQNEIDTLIGTFDDFLHSKYLSFNNRAQFASKFFDLQPADRLALFSDILSLDNWTAYSQKAKEDADKLSIQIMSKTHKLSELDGTISSLQGTDYSEQIKQWEQDRTKNIQQIVDKIQVHSNLIASTKIEMVDIAKEIQHWEQKHGKIILDLATDQKNSTDRKAELKKNYTHIGELTGIISRFKADCSRLGNLKGECPTCLQKVSEKHIHSCTQVIENDIEIHQKEFAQTEQNIKSQELYLKKIEFKIRELDEQKYKCQQEMSLLRADLKNMNDKIDMWVKELLTFESQIADAKKQINPYKTLDTERQQKLLDMLNQHDTELKQQLEWEKQRNLKDYWIKGFKEVRLYIIEEAVQELELHINNSLSNLGMDDWIVKLDVETETKAGQAKKGFVIMVQSPINSEYVPFECWSGGEGQRLRLAGTFGFIDFINDRTGIDWNVEIYDEPCTWLSEEGINDLLEVMFYRAKEVNKMLFLIDHRNLQTFGGFSGIINVIKDKQGTRIEI